MTTINSLDAIVVAARTQVSSILGGEAAILDTARGVYFGLNSVATRVWGLIQQPRTVRELRDSLVSEYEVEAERCESDLLSLLNELLAAGLIQSPRE